MRWIVAVVLLLPAPALAEAAVSDPGAWAPSAEAIPEYVVRSKLPSFQGPRELTDLRGLGEQAVHEYLPDLPLLETVARSLLDRSLTVDLVGSRTGFRLRVPL